MVLPPGTILQQIYLKERLKKIKPGEFIEVGTGNGALSHLLCRLGWRGIGYDLNHDALAIGRKINQRYIDLKQYDTRNENWLNAEITKPVDLVISSMVLEHLDATEEKRYLEKCKSILSQHGRLIILVPSSPKHWGIEDEIAGHYRRYNTSYLESLAKNAGLKIINIAGLTYPLSNFLYPISEWLVKRYEINKLKLTINERTKQSGNRNVLFKTTYPILLKFILNKIVLYPFHLLQKLFSTHPNCLITYLECAPIKADTPPYGVLA